MHEGDVYAAIGEAGFTELAVAFYEQVPTVHLEQRDHLVHVVAK